MVTVIAVALVAIRLAMVIFAIIKADKAYREDDVKNLIVWCCVVLMCWEW